MFRMALLIAALAASVAAPALEDAAKPTPAAQQKVKPKARKAGKKLKKASVPYYFCPMHPEVHQGHAGSCSKCGMDLVLRQEGK